MPHNRKHERIIDLHMRPITVRKLHSHAPLFGATLDVSLGGAQVTVEEPAPIEQGDHVELLFDDPEIEVTGVVRWCRHTRHSCVFGVQFDDLLPQWAVAA